MNPRTYLLAISIGLGGLIGCANADNAHAQRVEASCVTLQKFFGDIDGADAATFTPSILSDALSECKTAPSRSHDLFQVFLSYHEARENRDYPNSMVNEDRGAGSYRENVKKLDSLLSQLGKFDEQTLSPMLRYMIRQRENIEFAWSALEIVARLFPDSYANYRTQDSDTERAWKLSGERWLKR